MTAGAVSGAGKARRAPYRSGFFEMAIDVGAGPESGTACLGKGRGGVPVSRAGRGCIEIGSDLYHAIPVAAIVRFAAGVAGRTGSGAGRPRHVGTVIAGEPAGGSIPEWSVNRTVVDRISAPVAFVTLNAGLNGHRGKDKQQKGNDQPRPTIDIPHQHTPIADIERSSHMISRGNNRRYGMDRSATHPA